MTESGKIDWACHANDAAASIHDVLEMSNAVQAAEEFYNAHPNETLILVTADHETGGLTLLDGDERTGRVMGCYVTDDHTPAMLPVFAYGPGADRFCGVYLNTEIARRIRVLYDERKH